MVFPKPNTLSLSPLAKASPITELRCATLSIASFIGNVEQTARKLGVGYVLRALVGLGFRPRAKCMDFSNHCAASFGSKAMGSLISTYPRMTLLY